MALPCLLWVALDRAPFGGDQSQYAAEAVNLFRILRDSPSDWPAAMARSIGSKAPGIAWIGQLFVPVGSLVGSVDAGLLLLIGLAYLLAVLTTFLSARALADGDARAGAVAGLVVASAPLSVRLSHEFLVETLQMLATAYFVLIAALSPRWSRSRVLAHLLLASALALLAKATSPLFCFGPGLLALGTALAPRPARRWEWRRPSTLVPLAAGLLLALAAARWYQLNLEAVRRHAAFSSSGWFAAHWGKEDTFFNTLLYWLGIVGTELCLPPLAVLAAGAVAAAGIAFVAGRRPPARFTACAVVAALQTGAVLAAFSTVDSRVTRYLLPVLPHFALLVGWAVAGLGRTAVARTAVVTLAVQLAVVQGHAFGLFPGPFSGSVPTIDTSGRSRAVLEGIVDRTCGGTSGQPYLVVVGIEPSLKGDWLAPVPASYVSAKRRLARGTPVACSYDYLGGSFFGGSPFEVWADMMARDAHYFVTLDPGRHPPPASVFNRALDAQNLPVLLRKVRESGEFEAEPPLAQDRAVWVFRRSGRGAPLSAAKAVDARETLALFARLSAKEAGDGEARVETRPEGILIHPGERTKTAAQFRLGGTVRALTLAGFIAPLPEAALPVVQAGTVSVELRADGRLLDTVAVDRYTPFVTRLDLQGVEVLTVTVGNADGRAWWDWFILGVVGRE